MKNAYFEELERIGNEWNKAKEERLERKDQIIKEFGWDSKELKKWHEEDEAAKFPYGQGTVKAFWAWKYSDDEIEMSEPLWKNEVEDFVEALRVAGIKSFIFTNHSTSVMENIHGFAEAGCTMQDLVKETKKDRWGEDKEIMGIRFAVN